MIRIPAYVSDYSADNGGDVGKLRGFCSAEWKRDVSRWHLRQKFGRTAKFCEWIGYSTDEIRRAQRTKTFIKDAGKWSQRYPLIEINISRTQCKKIVRDYGWADPPRSSCWMCPHHSDSEWRDIRDNRPDEWKKAQRFEAWLKKQNEHEEKTVHLHRKAQTLADAPIDEDTSQGDFGFCDTGGCYT